MQKGIYNVLKRLQPIGSYIEDSCKTSLNNLWKKNKDIAAIAALFECKMIDWDLYYLQNNIKNSTDLNPMIHFINVGIWQGFKLPVRLNKLSIIIFGDNAEIFLEKCLRSFSEQILLECQIIIVSDSQTEKINKTIIKFDGILKDFKYIQTKSNSPENIYIIKGLAEVNGEYVLFLRSYNFLTKDAYGYIISEIIHKYDIIAFDIHLILPLRNSCINGIDTNIYSNMSNVQYFKSRQDVYNIIFNKKKINMFLDNKVVRTQICKKALMPMHDLNLPKQSDPLFLLPIIFYANTMKYINRKILFYNIRLSGKRSLNNKLLNVDYYNTLEYELNNICHPEIFDELLNIHISSIMQLWLGQHSKSYKFFNQICKKYGIINVLGCLLDKYYLNWNYIADIFIDYKVYMMNIDDVNKKIRSIGIIYSELSIGGIERFLPILCNLLIDRGYKVTLFLEKKNERDENVNNRVKIVYLPVITGKKVDCISYLTSLYNELRLYKIDLVMYHSYRSPELIWLSILFHYLGIYIWVFQHSDFCRNIVSPSKFYPQFIVNKVLKCMDQIICLSIYSELYLRTAGVNASYLPHPILPLQPTKLDTRDRFTIVVNARLSEPVKQVNDCLYILHEVKKVYPQTKIIFIGGFTKNALYDSFMKNVSKLKLNENIILTGWTDNPIKYVSQGSVMLSTSLTESFGLSICEAQSIGLPCVMYDVPIMAAEENPGIIKVKQGDYKEAAKIIVKIFSEPNLWELLSRISKENIRKFSPDKYIDKLNSLIQTFRYYSHYSCYTKLQYLTVIHTLSFHASRNK